MSSPQHASDHWHYQHVSSTTYPESRKKLAELHAKRSNADYDKPGWVVGARSRAAAAAAASSAKSTVASPEKVEAPLD